MKIARNILLRNKAKKTLEKKHEGFFPIERLDNGAQSILEKRLNQNLRNRLQTMLSYNDIHLEDVADFLSLLEARLKLNDMDIEMASTKMKELDKKYGSYSKGMSTMDELDINDDIGFIPYEHRHIATIDQRKRLGMGLTEQQKEKEYKKKHKKKKKKMDSFLW